MKAYDRYVAKARTNERWSEAEINGARRAVHAAGVGLGWRLLNAIQGPYSITSDQTRKGLEFLHKKMFTARGEMRKTAFTRCFSERHAGILRNFARFTFDGLEVTGTAPDGRIWSTAPIYTVHSTDGRSFSYWMTPRGLPTVSPVEEQAPDNVTQAFG
jgi:hypothetical protein